MSPIEDHYGADVRLGTARLKKEIGYNPAYFNRMVAEHGAVEASRRLIMADTVSDGFTKLWEHRRLGMSVEALALLPWYTSLFDNTVVSKARRRLEAHDFDVDEYLQTVDTPDWWS